MRVTIEIYRSRIGSRHNFMGGQNLKSNFQGQFWNEMLLKFHISLFLPPNVKFRFNMMHKNNAQYDQCHVYNIVQLLLRLSNDVEENPGPTIDDTVDFPCTIHASFNQGNDLFGSNAGKQCVAMSLSAIVYKEVKSVNIWNQSTLNTIMVCGRDNKQQIESPQEKKARLEKQQLRKKKSRKNKSLEQREQRLAKVREYNRKGNKEQGESPQEKKARLEKQQLRKKKSRKNESLEQREQRLAKMREHVSNKRKIESQKASPASRGQKSSKQKRNIGNHETTDSKP